MDREETATEKKGQTERETSRGGRPRLGNEDQVTSIKLTVKFGGLLVPNLFPRGNCTSQEHLEVRIT